MTTTESENFYRVISLLIDAGTEVLRKLFMSFALSSGATTLYNYLSSEQAKIFKLQKSKYLKSHQVSLLLGHGSSSGIDINTWDINLLCVLLKVSLGLSFLPHICLRGSDKFFSSARHYSVQALDCATQTFTLLPESLFLTSWKLLSHIMRKPIFGVCDQVRLKLACSASEAS